MKFRSAYQFMLWYFQNILDVLERDGNYWTEEAFNKQRADLCEEYRQAFRLDPEGYSDEHVWRIIDRKFDKHFDYLLGDVIDGK